MRAASIQLIVCTACMLVLPASVDAQGRHRFAEALVSLSNAVSATHGDEGPILTAAVDAMELALREWDALVAKVEAGFASEIGAAPPMAAARMHAALGTVYLDRGRLKDALAQFENSLKLDPQLADVHLLQGLTYELLGDRARAASAHRQLWQRSAGHAAHAYLFIRSSDPAGSNELSRAVQVLLQAVEQVGASDGEPLFEMLNLIDEASVTAPVFPPAAYADAVASLAARQYDAAAARLREAVHLDPLVTDRALEDATVRDAIASLRAGATERAIARLEEAAARTTSSELSRILGLAYRDAEQPDRSLVLLRRAVQINPDDERARLAIADVLVDLGDPAAARDALVEVTTAMPGSGLAFWKLGRLHQLMGDEIRALRAFEAAAAIPALAGAAHVHAAIGRLYYSQLDLDAAAAAHAQRTALSPNDGAAHLDLGEIHHAQGQLDRAMAAYAVATLLDPTNAQAFATIGQLHAAEGRDEAAVRMLRRAIDLDAAHREARYALSRALMRLGRTDEARRELETFERLQAQAMEEERQRFRDNQLKIEEALKAGEPGADRR